MTFNQLYTDYQAYVRSIISRRTPSADVQDLEQDLWMLIAQHVEAGTVPPDVKPWMANLSRTTCRDYHRHRERTISLDAPAGEDGEGNTLTVADRIGDVAEPVLDAGAVDNLREGLDELPPRTKEVMDAHYYADKSIQEIAFELGMSIGTVKWHLATGRNALRDMFAPADDQQQAA